MPTILVTGAAGLLGSSLVPALRQMGYMVKTHAHMSDADYRADLSDPDATAAMLDCIAPDVIINLIGLTDVDRCESHPDLAYRGNVRPVENLMSRIRSTNSACHLIHISTDQVYDGAGPHREEQVQLTNTYAFSKYAGELAALAGNATILRTNFFGISLCPKRQSLTDWLFHSLSSGESIQVFEDIYFSPLSMTTLCRQIEYVIRTRCRGVFNLGSQNGMSKADFAFAFADSVGLPAAAMVRTTSDKVSFLKTYRPKDMRMDNARFEKTFQHGLPDLADEINLVAMEYRDRAA